MSQPILLTELQIPRLYLIVIVNLVEEACIIILSSYLWLRLQMRKATKFVVFGLFAFRAGYVEWSQGQLNMSGNDDCRVAAILIGYLLAFTRYHTRVQDSAGIVTPLMWQEALLGYSLISATIPTMKRFLGRFATGYLVRLPGKDITSTKITGTRHGASYPLSTFPPRADISRPANAMPNLNAFRLEHSTNRMPMRGLSREAVTKVSEA